MRLIAPCQTAPKAHTRRRPTTASRLKVDRVPSMVIGVLQAIEQAGLGEHFTVVGTHALYAYETAAGVRIVPAALATQDVDLLWDARQRIRFITNIEKLDLSVLKILQQADPTFQRKDGQNETAINAKGFEVDFLRRQPEGDDPHPFRFSADEDDLCSPRFSADQCTPF